MIRQFSAKKDRGRVEKLIHSFALKYHVSGTGMPALVNITENECKEFLREQVRDPKVKARAEKTEQMYLDLVERSRR